MRKKFITDEEVKFLQDNYCNLGYKECARLMGKDEKYIKMFTHEARYKKQYGLRLTKEAKSRLMGRPRGKEDSEYGVHPDTFRKVELPETAYLLGLIWADGYVYNNDEKNAHKIVIENLYGDALIFRDIASKTGEWKFYERNRKNMRKQARIVAFNRPLVKYLVDHDYLVKSAASADKILNTIPDELKHYFFLGLVDGDGCICKKSYMIGIYSSMEQNWGFMESICKKLDISYRISKRQSDNGNSSSFIIGRKSDFFKFGRYIFQDKDKNGIGLDRKYLIYKQKLDKLQSCS